MHRATLHIKKPGLQTLVQDFGRLGHQAFGVPVGGVMDKAAARTANWLVGNDHYHSILEMALVGPEIEIEGSCQLALTGAVVDAHLNGNPLNMYETIAVKSHATLQIGQLLAGSRTYLAISGEWKIEEWLGSSSAFLLGDEGLTSKSIIKKGSQLEISVDKTSPKREFPLALRPQYSSKISIGIIKGPEFHTFSKKAIHDFFSRSHEVGSNSNRMGYRLNSVLEDFDNKTEVISSGIVPGTIQITNSGQPIILMADAQTTGGYPRIGNVITAHLDKLAQARPGDSINFNLITLDDAHLALKDQHATLDLVLQ